MTLETLRRRLLDEAFVVLTLEEWQDVSPAFEEVERHRTFLAGDLVIARDDQGPVAVEEPRPRERVVRRLAGEEDVRAFVQDRLDTYERMWDGCGCKVEYYR